jgi:hypothetical protein
MKKKRQDDANKGVESYLQLKEVYRPIEILYLRAAVDLLSRFNTSID